MKKLNLYINEKLIVNNTIQNNTYAETIWEFVRKYNISDKYESSGFSRNFQYYDYNIEDTEVIKKWGDKIFTKKFINKTSDIKEITNALNINKKYEITLYTHKNDLNIVSRLTVIYKNNPVAQMNIKSIDAVDMISFIYDCTRKDKKELEKIIVNITDYILETYEDNK